MWIYILRRTLLLIPIFFIISVVVFSLIHLVPGDPIDSLLIPGSTAEDRVELTKAYGLDKPLPVQYGVWLQKFITGDMGISIIEKQPVKDMILYNMPFTIRLGVASLFASFFWGFYWELFPLLSFLWPSYHLNLSGFVLVTTSSSLFNGF